MGRVYRNRYGAEGDEVVPLVKVPGKGHMRHIMARFLAGMIRSPFPR
jgi:hypothetical protein